MNTINCFSEFPMAEEEYTPTAGKETTPKEKVIHEVEYNLVDYLKKDKENISLFELLKIPPIRENLPKSMVLNK